MKIYSLFPQVPLTTEVAKAAGKIGLVAGVLEAKCSAEVDQCRFVHAVAVFAKIFLESRLVMKMNTEAITHISMDWTVCWPSSPTT